MNSVIDYDNQVYLLHFWMKNKLLDVQEAIIKEDKEKLEELFSHYLKVEYEIDTHEELAREMIRDFYDDL